jgi:hypothetical protein
MGWERRHRTARPSFLTGSRRDLIIAVTKMTSALVRLANNVWTGFVRLAAGILRVFGVTIGRQPYAPTDCGPSDPPPGCYPNPWPCGADIIVRVFDATGGLATYEDCGEAPHIVVRDDRGFKGIDAAAWAEFRFPAAPTVIVRVVHFSNPGRVEAFEQSGALADTKMMGPVPAVEEEITLRGSAIARVVVTPPSPADETRVVVLCH